VAGCFLASANSISIQMYHTSVSHPLVLCRVRCFHRRSTCISSGGADASGAEKLMEKRLVRIVSGSVRGGVQLGLLAGIFSGTQLVTAVALRGGVQDLVDDGGCWGRCGWSHGASRCVRPATCPLVACRVRHCHYKA